MYLRSSRTSPCHWSFMGVIYASVIYSECLTNIDGYYTWCFSLCPFGGANVRKGNELSMTLVKKKDFFHWVQKFSASRGIIFLVPLWEGRASFGEVFILQWEIILVGCKFGNCHSHWLSHDHVDKLFVVFLSPSITHGVGLPCSESLALKDKELLVRHSSR